MLMVHNLMPASHALRRSFLQGNGCTEDLSEKWKAQIVLLTQGTLINEAMASLSGCSLHFGLFLFLEVD